VTLGGQRILFTGDTECTPELKAVTNIAVAFVTMNLPFTMPPDEAAACVKAFRPRIVYPYHYRQQGLEPADQNRTEFIAAMKGFAGVEVRSAEFYPAAPGGRGGGGRGGGRGGGGGAAPAPAPPAGGRGN
jgi:L-ascorbate metabolism protein UlaG (beta-lactamase superfamily)